MLNIVPSIEAIAVNKIKSLPSANLQSSKRWMLNKCINNIYLFSSNQS